LLVGSDPFLDVAWTVGLGSIAVTVALALQVLVMRERSLARERRRTAAVERWRPVVLEWLLGGEPDLPRLPRRDEGTLLLLWNQIHDGVRGGEERARLNALGERLDLHAMALRRLDRRDALARLLALRTLGHLGREGDYPRLVRHLDDSRAHLCLAAAGALVRIDPRAAPRDVLSRLAQRGDWPVPLVATVLADADADAASAWFRASAPGLAAAQLVRLLPLAASLAPAAGEEIVLRILAASDDAELLAAALRAVRGPACLPHVRRACGHEAWSVRTQAAAALGRVGEPPDREGLARLLRDPEWWVRYRAAQALVSGRFGPAPDVLALAEGLGDPFARDVVAHAIAEGRP
jgi:HEAT repeat protein